MQIRLLMCLWEPAERSRFPLAAASAAHPPEPDLQGEMGATQLHGQGVLGFG